MSENATQKSNATGLSIAKEDSIGVLPTTPLWHPMEPNTYKDFGPTYKLVARSPINANRERKKGVITDLDVTAGFQSDMTYENTQVFIEGVMFANFREKAKLSIATVTSSSSTYAPASGGGAYAAGDLLFAKGFTAPANDGLKLVASGASAAVVAGSGLVDAADGLGTVSKVGFQFASGDVTLDSSGAYLKMNSTAKDFTTLGLMVGEWVYVGDDATAMRFASGTGWARLLTITAHQLIFDKIEGILVTDAGTSKTVRMFFGRVVRNEQAANIVRSTYAMERTLGKEATDSAGPQSEICHGSLLNDFMVTFNNADKVTWDLAAMSTTYETRTSADGLLSGTRLPLIEGSAVNTTSNVKRLGLELVGSNTELYADVMTLALTINNAAKANKAIGKLGPFEFSEGNFTVSAAVQAYFSNVEALASIGNNANVTVDAIIAKDNQGIVFDMPLITLGDGKLKVVANEAVMLPLTADAAGAALIDPAKPYTLAIMYYDYLPNLAM